MHIYTVQKGEHYFKGYKFQPFYYQLLLLIVGIILKITLGSWWYIIGSIICFLLLSILESQRTQSKSIRTYFLPNCAYQLMDNYDQVNKLYGFSEGFHHWNSARIGWRCTDGKFIELVAYCYINGKRVIKPMLKCKTESWVFCNIQNKTNKYVFKALTSSQSITVSVDKDKKFSIYSLFKLFTYRLFPYFGGKIAAPHNMGIYITKLTL